MSLATIVAAIFEKYADRAAVGMRVRRLVSGVSGDQAVQLEPRYCTLTYSKFWQRTGYAAASLYHHRQAPVRAGDTVAMLSFTNADYAALDIACIRIGAMTVPLQTGSSFVDLLAILDETRPILLASSIEQLDIAIECLIKSSSIRRLVVLDSAELTSLNISAIESAKIRLQQFGNSAEVSTFQENVEVGKILPDVELDTRLGCDNELAMLIYTSGSTGVPKGAMYTQKLAAGMWGGTWSTIFSEGQALTFHYMPMSHVAGHSSLKGTLARGGTCFFTAQANLSTLIEDISLVKPTELSLVPRVCEMIYQKYQGELARNGAVEGDPQSKEILDSMRVQEMGGRVAWASCSSAPLGPELNVFTERLLGIPLHNVYGSTEAGAVWIDNELVRPPIEDYKLVDVPELGYYYTDRPYPRGELLLKTSSIIPGYYKRPDLIEDLFSESGFYRTGDIVAEQGEGKLFFVDRRKNVVKLSQGEFVALARLEILFSGIADLDNIFVHANSEWPFPLAVVVPNERLRSRAYGDEKLIRSTLLEALRDTAKEAGLRSFEIPRDLILASERFTQQNGLLSDHGKPLWSRLRHLYEAQLDNLYEDIKNREIVQLQSIYERAKHRPPLEVVLQAIGTVLGISAETIGVDRQFLDLGGDSLSAVTLSTILSEAFSLAVPVDVIISPVYNLGHIADYIVKKACGDLVRPTAEEVHGKDANKFHASDLSLKKFLTSELLSQQSSVGYSRTPLKTILLTGATGFFGRFLALDLLQRFSIESGKLICVVRAKDTELARERLLETLKASGRLLSGRFAEFEQKLEVIAGDISQERLGLDTTTWTRLSEEVDSIIHVGALVNHLLPYESLFDANVNSTAELIALALTHHQKPIIFMSSIAVSTLLGDYPAQPLDEDQDIREWASTVSAEDTYAAGYGLTKWASEVLLREAEEKFGLPVTVYRSSMILAHSHEVGQLNVPDMFTRLLLSVAATGVAPRSFYQADEQNCGKDAHYDGLPVDFSCAAIIKTSIDQASKGYRTYHLVNHHDDGISLDSFIGWMKISGVQINAINDYDEWLRRFEYGMRSLPERERAKSMLPLLHSLSTPAKVQRGSSISSARFQSALALDNSLPVTVPMLDQLFIERYVSGLQALGLIPVEAVESSAVP